MDASLFTEKVYYMLEDQSLSNVVSWTEDGTGFTINNTVEFTERVLPHYFRHKNLASFVRQLNIYGFQKSRDINLFSHPLFVRGRPEQIKKIERKPKKEKEIRKSEISAFVKQLYKAHKQNKKSESTVKKLENAVFNLENQNNKLVKLITESRERSLKLESMLISVMEVLRNKEEPFRKMFEQDSLDAIMDSRGEPNYNPLNFEESDTDDIYGLLGN